MTKSTRTNHSTPPAWCLPHPGQPLPTAAGAPDAVSRAEVAARSVSAPTATERRRWRVIGLLHDGVPLAEIVAQTGYRARTIRELAQRYRTAGTAALADRRARSPGAPALLTPALQHELRQALEHPPSGGGRWTGPKVAQWIAERTGTRVHRQRGWEYLRRLGGVEVPARAEQSAAERSIDDGDRTA
jgi:transposase